MTSEEKAKEIFSDNKHECETHGYAQDNGEILFMIEKMGLWKDEQFAKEKQVLIDKACEWLKGNVSRFLVSYGPESSDVCIEKASLIKNFRKSIEEMK